MLTFPPRLDDETPWRRGRESKGSKMRPFTIMSAMAMLLLGFVLLAGPTSAVAHPGGLNASGCHTIRKTREYHCHRAQAAPATSSASSTSSNAGVSGQLVKKSNSGICHVPGSTYYARTQNYVAFSDLDECLASGGRLPKQ